MKKISILLVICAFFAACGGNAEKSTTTTETSSTEPTKSEPTKSESANPSYDPQRGEGKFTEVSVGATVDQTMASAGEKVYGVKCGSCHKLTSEKTCRARLAGCNRPSYCTMDHEFCNQYRCYAG